MNIQNPYDFGLQGFTEKESSQQLLRNVLIGVLSVFAVMNTMSGTFVQELLPLTRACIPYEG